jgi:hypothetical protein
MFYNKLFNCSKYNKIELLKQMEKTELKKNNKNNLIL